MHLSHSNKANILFIDVRPGLASKEYFEQNLLPTIAHELQHMVNYTYHLGQGNTKGMDSWIDEGLSTSAEYLYMKVHAPGTGGRTSYFNGDPQKTIRNGNMFLLWDDPSTEFRKDIQANYASVYLFFQWLRLHAVNDEGLFPDILHSPYADYRAVVDSARRYMPSLNLAGVNYGADWDSMFGTWLAANVILSTSSVYGYKADEIKVAPNSPTWATNGDIGLYQGEAVYSRIAGSLPNLARDDDANVRYLRIPDGADAPLSEDEPTPSAGMLISYNANPNTKPLIRERAYVAAPIEPSKSSGPAMESDAAGFVIDVRDLERARHNMRSDRITVRGTVSLDLDNELVLRDAQGCDWHLGDVAREALASVAGASAAVVGVPEQQTLYVDNGPLTKKRYFLRDAVPLALPSDAAASAPAN
jgi:prepilin-type processing-associated H-X9-DG protein